MKSRSAKLISVRRVTQDNQGAKTAGVDGKKNLTPKQRFALVDQISLGSKVSLRRVWIPKPGKDEKRPLGIPTINDRALQCLVKMALEPTLVERPTLLRRLEPSQTEGLAASEMLGGCLQATGGKI